jgi:hypothetical protein
MFDFRTRCPKEKNPKMVRFAQHESRQDVLGQVPIAARVFGGA